MSRVKLEVRTFWYIIDHWSFVKNYK